ncbi:hypothetical protein SRIMM317S_03433 [Streptomyces rimosus subsp. rimosus]
MANKTPPDSTRRSERSRRAIYDAALALVGEVGYNKLTIEGIAARAGVGKQTIYRWWPSKAAVLLDAFTQDVEGYEAGMPDTGDLAADLKFVLLASVDEFADCRSGRPPIARSRWPARTTRSCRRGSSNGCWSPESRST